MDFKTSSGETISLGDNTTCEVHGTGTVLIEKRVDNTWKKGKIENVLYVPKIRKNLFSVGICTTKNYEVCFKDDRVTILLDGRSVAQGVKQGNEIYRMLFRVNRAEEANMSCGDLKTWHDRLGHVNKKVISRMARDSLVKGVQLNEAEDDNPFCESCQLGKQHRLPFNKEASTDRYRPGEMFHSDVCGPMSVQSLGGARYFVLFKDDASGYRHVSFIKHKFDVFDKFKGFEKMVANKFGHSMKILRTDNGREYSNSKFKRYLAAKEIRLENTIPYTPQQNGKSVV